MALAATCAALLALGMSACGGGSSSGGSGTAHLAEEPSQAGEANQPGQAGQAGGQAKGSAGFIVPGGDNSVQRFGSEAPAEEREAASRVVVSYLRARAAKDYGAECAALARSTVAPLRRLIASSHRGRQVSCVDALGALAGSRPAPENPLTGPIGSLRVDGDRAFALFHGRGGVDYTLSMQREGPIWKVATLEPVPLN